VLQKTSYTVGPKSDMAHKATRLPASANKLPFSLRFLENVNFWPCQNMMRFIPVEDGQSWGRADNH
jgi:hypothetical protein